MPPWKKVLWSISDVKNHHRFDRLLKTARSGCLLIAFVLLASGGEALAEDHGAGSGLGLVTAIGLAVASAAIVSVIFHRFQQPALLAYIIAGLILQAVMSGASKSSIATMGEVSHLGLVFLLFIIGIEMDLGGILRLGKGPAAAVLLQAPVAFIAIIGVQWAAGAAGLSIPGLGSQGSAWFYYAVVVALSSTAVVVKLLGDKFDLGSQAGRLTVLTLIAQDVWAVMALSYVTIGGSGTGTGASSPLLMIGGMMAAVAAIILATRFVLTSVLARLARSPDLLALASLGWCFLCAEAVSMTGLSAEMGALLAGLSIGRLPVRTEVLSRVSSLRDFFMALFFVSLGISLPSPSAAIMGNAIPLALIVVLARGLLFMPTLLAARLGPVVSAASTVNLAQISEFALLMIPVGLAKGALTQHDASVISYAMMLSVLLATYAIRYNYVIAIAFEKLAGRGRRKTGQHGDAAPGGESRGAEIVFLGHHFNSEALAAKIAAESPELLKKILVIDFDLQNHPRIRAIGLDVVYGDISNSEVLRHFGVSDAKVVVCTIGDTFLRGTSNEELLGVVKSINPDARVITTASVRQIIDGTSGRGAWACISPEIESSTAYLAAIRKALKS